MLSYRHAFHAGNHADVLKHAVLIQLLRYLGQKDAPYMYIDTHAGAGVYALDSGYAAKNAEYETGIARLWNREKLSEPLEQYRQLIKELNPSGQLRYYPGSPYIADKIARESDRLRLFELHPADGKLLQENFRKLEAHEAAQGRPAPSRGKRVMVYKEDGFNGLKALLPPPSRRGLVLVDPPYEVKNDYRRVLDTIEDALQRFATGIYAVWYPILQRTESHQMQERLKRLNAHSWLDVTLSISAPLPDGFGLHSSGMFILNPPWTLEPMLRTMMPELVQILGVDQGAGFTVKSGESNSSQSSRKRG
ncbi:23S rRNA (adenine(2030)-N(6))-methyltransferase RlmJ [Oxalobacteraceae bacterium R-40]|uniref:Ribosomal RNA large subunit methyltransferase J n=1 Tax=Keguizhuia sedimenti TaxID=3064264 RepID=A0ABU1BRX5_9BURK|nr:23S rRNA (adenine(2030)-N(6))-methyltransferase RlmJ [Oxalobacteraceae bacterium R-40]